MFGIEGFSWATFLSEMAAIATVLAGIGGLWAVFIHPKQKAKAEKAEKLEAQRDEQHKKEIDQLREHFELDNTIKGLADKQKEQGEDLRKLAKDVDSLRKDQAAQGKELSETHISVSNIEKTMGKLAAKMDAHVEQSAADRQAMEGRFATVETKVDGLAERS